MFPTMFQRLAHQVVTLVLALGISLGGIAPSWAAAALGGKSSSPAAMAMSMPGMVMQSAYMGSPDKSMPGKPCKNMDSSCAMCTGCAIQTALLQETSFVRLLVRGYKTALPQDANRDGIAVVPALPPPILLS